MIAGKEGANSREREGKTTAPEKRDEEAPSTDPEAARGRERKEKGNWC